MDATMGPGETAHFVRGLGPVTDCNESILLLLHVNVERHIIRIGYYFNCFKNI